MIFDDTIWTLFSKLSENPDIGSTEFKLWQLKESPEQTRNLGGWPLTPNYKGVYTSKELATPILAKHCPSNPESRYRCDFFPPV